VAYAVAYTGPQRDSAAVFSVQLVRSEAETSKAASFKTAAFVHSATPPELNLSLGPYRTDPELDLGAGPVETSYPVCRLKRVNRLIAGSLRPETPHFSQSVHWLGKGGLLASPTGQSIGRGRWF
jgi:hypothetical protein